MQNTKTASIRGHHGPNVTFTGFRFEEAICIDFIMMYEGENNKIIVLHHGVLCDCWDNNYPPSDHRPVVADVIFNIRS